MNSLHKKRQRLNTQFRRKLDIFLDDLMDSEETLSLEKVDEIERLAKIIEITNQSIKRSRNQPWILFMTILGAIILVGLLHSCRKTETEVVLEAKLSGLSFQMSEDKDLSRPSQLSSLGIIGVQEMQCGGIEYLNRISSDGSFFNVKLISNTLKDSSSYLNVLIINVSKGTDVQLEPLESDNKWRLSLSNISSDLTLNSIFSGEIHVGISSNSESEKKIV